MTLPISHKWSCSTGHIWGEQWVHTGYGLRSDPWDAHMTFPSPKSRGVWALPYTSFASSLGHDWEIFLCPPASMQQEIWGLLWYMRKHRIDEVSPRGHGNFPPIIPQKAFFLSFPSPENIFFIFVFLAMSVNCTNSNVNVVCRITSCTIKIITD